MHEEKLSGMKTHPVPALMSAQIKKTIIFKHVADSQQDCSFSNYTMIFAVMSWYIVRSYKSITPVAVPY